MDDRVSITRSWFKDYHFHLVSNVDQLKQLIDICIQRKLCSIDVETTGLDNRIYSDEYFEDGIKTRHGFRTIDRIVGCCLSFDGLHGYYVPLTHEPEDSGNLPWDLAWDEFTRLVQAGTRCIFHGGRFDQEFLYPVLGREFWKLAEFEDTLLMAKVINPLKSQPAGLKPLIRLHYSLDTIDIHELFTQEKLDQLKREKRGVNFALLHPKEGLEYGCCDGIFTYKMLFTLKEKLEGCDQKIYDLEKSFSNVMRKMERNRVHIDVERVQQLNVECQQAITHTGDLIRNILESKTGKTGKWLTLKIGSPKALSQALITDQEGLRLKPTAEMTGDENIGWRGGGEEGGSDDDDDDDDESDNEKQYTLKDEALKSLQRAYGSKYSIQREGVIDKDGKPKPESIFDLILEYRHYDKMKGSYVDKLFRSHDRYGDVRPSFNQMGTDTCRLSCKAGKIDEGYSGVNFQGIPRDSDEDKPELFKQIRTCIVPRPGHILVKIDFAGEELRVVTNLSGDPIWTKSFLFEDGDVHSITSRTLFGKPEVNKDERNRGKRCNFAFIYGGGAGSIQRNIGCSIEDAQRHMDNLKRDVPVLMGYVEHQKKFAHKHKCIFTSFGRRLPIPTIDSPIRAIRSKAERCAINYTIQSTSADVLKLAMCWMDKQIRALGWEDRVKYVLTVHDEVVFEVKPEYLQEVVRKLDEWMTLPWKLPKEHGREWIVPLTTEPGIDINWRAKYNYFEMVDGVPPKPKELDSSGNFIGKLKKGQYFKNGRVYQEVPQFLQAWLKPSLPASPTVPELPANESISDVQTSSQTPKTMPTPEVRSVPESEVQAAPAPTLASSDTGLSLDVDLDSLISSSNVSTALEIGLGTIKETPETPEPELPSVPIRKSDPILPPPKPPVEGETVLRWMMRAVPSQYVMRKLQAVCILAEGDTPLRIINAKGEVIVNENEGIRISPSEFKILSRMFGL